MKRFTLALFLIVIMVIAMLPVYACADGGGEPALTTVPAETAETSGLVEQTTVPTSAPSTVAADPLGDEVEQLLQDITDANAAADDLGDVSEID